MPRFAVSLLALVATFLSACADQAEGQPDATHPDGPQAAFEAYRGALRSEDFTALRTHLSARARANMPEDLTPYVELFRAMVPPEVEVLSVRVNGDRATLRLLAPKGESRFGEVSLVREEGAWKIDGENWSNREPDAGPEPEIPAEPVPEGEWNLSLAGAVIPQRPARGQVGGRPFDVMKAEWNAFTKVLVLQDGDGFEWTGKFYVFLFLDDNESPAGRSFTFDRKANGGEVSSHVHMHTRLDDEVDIDSQVDGFALRLEFDEIKDGVLPGRIYLCYPDDAKSYVAGTFRATVD